MLNAIIINAINEYIFRNKNDTQLPCEPYSQIHCIQGAIQQLRGQNFAIFCSPEVHKNRFYFIKRAHFRTVLKVRKFQNENMKLSHSPKYERKI